MWLLSANCRWAASSEMLSRPTGRRGESEAGLCRPPVADGRMQAVSDSYAGWALWPGAVLLPSW